MLRAVVRGMATEAGPLEKLITSKLRARFSPRHLVVKNESYLHNVPRGAEKHFLVEIVCDDFEGKTIMQRHRLVNECLAEELAGPLHALRITATPPSKYNGEKAPPAPVCQGGGNL